MPKSPSFPLEPHVDKILHQPNHEKGLFDEHLMERTRLNVKFARLDGRAVLPTQGSAGAAGWDLYAIEDTTVPKGRSVLIRTGWACAIPVGWEGQLRCRSSLGKKGMILPNGIGTIDADYRGELMVLATWIGEGDAFQIAAGERVAQMLFAPVPDVTLIETDLDALGDTERGTGGFGSSGQF